MTATSAPFHQRVRASSDLASCAFCQPPMSLADFIECPHCIFIAAPIDIMEFDRQAEKEPEFFDTDIRARKMPLSIARIGGFHKRIRARRGLSSQSRSPMTNFWLRGNFSTTGTSQRRNRKWASTAGPVVRELSKARKVQILVGAVIASLRSNPDFFCSPGLLPASQARGRNDGYWCGHHKKDRCQFRMRNNHGAGMFRRKQADQRSEARLRKLKKIRQGLRPWTLF